MPMVCPQCNGSFEQRLQCPHCGVRLLYQAPPESAGGLWAEEGSWQQTPWGRLVIGLLMAQGLYYGFRQLCMAGFLVTASETARQGDVWGTLGGIALLQGLQLFSVFAAGLLTGAGKIRGFGYGAVLGVWNGVLLLLAQYFFGQRGLLQHWMGQGWSDQPTLVDLLGQPMLHASCGALGGLIGSLIWKPLPQVALGPPALATKPKPVSRPSLSAFEGPVSLGRVLVGTAVAVGGVIWANVILDFVLDAGRGTLGLDTRLQTQLITWEICALAIVVGSALAGATTLNWMKQGLYVGFGVFTMMIGFNLTSAGVPRDLLIFTLLSALPLGIVGGWFGNQLFPALYRL